MKSLNITAGFTTLAGKRPRNEDFGGWITPRSPVLENKGVIAAIADGVSGSEDGGRAAQSTIKSVLSDYYATADTWGVKQSLEKVIHAANRWLIAQAPKQSGLPGSATTLSALAIRGRMAYFAHVGDTRIYLLREQKLQQLTADHSWQGAEQSHLLTRAIGMDASLTIDHGELATQLADVFLLVCDGVWASLSEKRIASLLNDARATDQPDWQALSQQICEEAIERGSQDNVTALIISVDALPDGDMRDSFSELRVLPVPASLAVGSSLDGFIVEEKLHESRVTVLYRVKDQASQAQLVLKTLTPAAAHDEQERAGLAHEEWLTKRANARYFAQPFVMPATRRSAFYIVSTWHAGHTLGQALKRDQHFTIPEVIKHASWLARAVGALHRRSIIHRDIKPDNIHFGDDGEGRLLDLGVALSGFEPASSATGIVGNAGTPTYIAPEQYEGTAPSNRSDIFALGVTLYEMLTRKFPYGEIEPFQRPRFGEPVPPSRYRPDLPTWLERVILKAVAKQPEDRFETAEELLLWLERGATQPLERQAAAPLIERGSLAAWRAVALGSILINALLLLWMIIKK